MTTGRAANVLLLILVGLFWYLISITTAGVAVYGRHVDEKLHGEAVGGQTQPRALRNVAQLRVLRVFHVTVQD